MDLPGGRNTRIRYGTREVTGMLKRILAAALLLVALFACRCLAEEQILEAHFLDVGQGDAAIIQCGGQTLMIDGGDKDHSKFVYEYLKDLGITRIDYMISTHPHDDHVYGLATALQACDVGIVYSPVTGFDGKGFESFQNKLQEKGAEITVPHRGDTFSLGGAVVTFLSEPQNWWNLNDMSIVVRVEFGECAFLFTGDAGLNAEQDLLSSGMDLRANVLKVGHHGGLDATSKAFVEAVNPQYAIISVGENNKFGHPAEDTLRQLQRSMVNVFRTDIHGTILCFSDGKNLGFVMTQFKPTAAPATPLPTPDGTDTPAPADTPAAAGNPAPGAEKEVMYIGNRNTHVFHDMSCPSIQDMKTKNKVELYSREEAIDLGFKPCGRCRP